MNSYKELRIADINNKNDSDIVFSKFQLTGAQLFIKNMFNPNTLHKRLLINWQTGVGKSIAAISIGNEFIKNYQSRYFLGETKHKIVCVLGFTTMETIQADLIKYPEFGYVTNEEVIELNNLIMTDDPKQSQFLGNLHKRLTNKSLGSYYQFYGYREFINNLFIITKKGISNKITVQDLFIDDDKNIINLINSDYIQINNDLLNLLKNSLIIADEIHNVYNSIEPNNYGLAIKYILDILDEDAPRIVFMSATPLTGNASEVIDLLNLLNPKTNLIRSDYFFKDSNNIYQLKNNTLDVIKKLSEGKISYLLDTDKELYPEKIFVGKMIDDIPYIKINECSIPTYYKNSILKEKEITQNITTQSYTLYDIVFPNPHSNEYGLYQDVINTILKAPNEWKESNDIDIYYDDNIPYITGSFLHIKNIKNYSLKYYNVLKDIIDNIKNNDGKIMIYHHRVQVSGVLLIEEMFRLNGFIDTNSDPNNNTLCVVCGHIFLNHDNSVHSFKPCRYIMAHSKINKNSMKKNIIKFNDESNLYGHEIKLIIGSRVIREGLNFKAVRYQYIMSLPINFPILIQVLGRVVRKNSHISLPKDQQNVYIKIYANEIEIPRYKLKAKEYLIIQQVEKVLRLNAVDNFINYKKIYSKIDTLESLKFNPINTTKPKLVTKYYDAYDYNNEEIIIIKKLLSLLFDNRLVWKYDDLWKELKMIKNVNFNLDLIDQDNFDIALYESNVFNINNEFYIKSSFLDVECFLRENNISPKFTINLNEKYLDSLENQIYTDILKIYNHYLHGLIELSLVELPEIFHIKLIKNLIIGIKVTSEDKKIIKLYKRFKIILNDNKRMGFIDKLSINFYNSETNTWYHEKHSKYNIDNRFEENSIIVGYVIDENKNTSRLKLREPISTVGYDDMRLIKKGMTCENYIKKDILKLLHKIRKFNDTEYHSKQSSKQSYASEYDDNYFNNQQITNICNIIKLYLLYFEEKNRSLVNGMKNSTRWVYLFHDNIPNMMIKK